MIWTTALMLATAMTAQTTAPPPPAPAPPARRAKATPPQQKEKPPGKADPTKKTAKPTPPAPPAEVRVRTKAEMDRPRSSFLMPPGGQATDRYGQTLDWNEIPPWKQTSFFGLRAKGLFFIYVIDGSGSMIDDDRFPRATIELRRSVNGLRPPQRFEVIFFNEESIPMPGGPIPRSADLDSKNQLRAWLRLMDPDGGTDPRLALKQALSLKPDAVFFLSDGVLPQGSVKDVARFNPNKIPIHCVDLAGGRGGDQLKRIAAESGGNYASRGGWSAERP